MKFKHIFSTILIFLLLLLSITGYYAYENFNAIITTFKDESKPDTYIYDVNNVISHVNSAETAAKTFRLTETPKNLHNFYDQTELTKELLKEMRKQYSGTRSIEIDSLGKLVEFKFKFLQDLTNSIEIYRVQEVLDKLYDELGPEQKESLDRDIENGGSENLLSRILKRKRNRNINNIDQEDIDRELSEVRSEERALEILTKRSDSLILSQIDSVSTMILSLTNNIEEAEKQNLIEKAEQADRSFRTTNKNILWFFLAIAVALIYMAFLIINYIKQNTLYRKTLQNAKQQSEDHAAERERFFASMSHELRTPLNAINGFSEQLNMSELSSGNREKIDMMKNASDHLIKLVNDLLDHSKLQANKLKLDQDYFPLYDLINDCVKISESLLKSDQSLRSSINIEQGLLVQGDEKRLKQIILNLLSNAIKFSPGGIISLNAELLKMNEGVRLICEVSDNGIGMDESQLQLLFKEYEQGKNSISKEFDGTGLGLWIVKQLVELHRGRINVDSTLNKGTTFRFELPYLEVKKLAASSNTMQKPKLEIKSVLVADDELYNRKLIANILEKHQIQYHLVDNGQDVLDHLKNNEVDLVLLDIRMPVLNGIETLKLIRKDEDLLIRSTPCIAISAALTEDETDELHKLRINGILVKPFKELELLSKMSDLGLKAKDIYPISNIEMQKDPIASIDFSNLKELSAGDQAFYRDMILTFKKDMEDGIDLLNASLKEKKYSNLADDAHRLCSPCRHLKCYTILDTLKNIENEAMEKNNKAIKEQLKLLKSAFDEISPDIEKELNA